MKTYTFNLTDEDLDQFAFDFLKRNKLYLYLNGSGKIITPLATIFLLLSLNYPFGGGEYTSNGVSYPDIAMKLEICFLSIIAVPIGWYANKYFKEKIFSTNLESLNPLRKKLGERVVTIDDIHISLTTQNKEVKTTIASITSIDDYDNFIVLKDETIPTFFLPKKNNDLYEHIKTVISPRDSDKDEITIDNKKSAAYLSKAIGRFFHLPLFLGSSILLLIIISSEQPMWLQIITPILMLISATGFWLTRKILWQVLYIHAIISYIAAFTVLIACIYSVYIGPAE